MMHHNLPDCLCKALQSSHACVQILQGKLEMSGSGDSNQQHSAALPARDLAPFERMSGVSETGTTKQKWRLTLLASTVDVWQWRL